MIQSMLHFKWHHFWYCFFIFLKAIVMKINIAKLQPIASVIESKNVVQDMLPTSFQSPMLPLVDLYQFT
jgi:hypothetical protein